MKKHFLFSLLFLLTCIVPAKAWNAMYLIGDATDAGWTAANAIEMTKVNDDLFEWSGNLHQGQLKLITTKVDGWWNYEQYGPAHDNYSTESEDKKTSYNDLVQRATYTAQQFNVGGTTPYEDYKFGIKDAGYYTIRLNCETNQITTFPQKIYPVGDGCEVRWIGDNVAWENYAYKSLTETAFASEVYEGDLILLNTQPKDEDGERVELKFLNQQGWGYMYGPTTAGENISGIGVYSIGSSTGTPDNKYRITPPEKTEYHIVADVRNGHHNVLKVSKDITFRFKMNALAQKEWGTQPVVIRYWMMYRDADDQEAYDHVFYQTLTPDEDGVYAATVQAVAPVKFIIQTCSDNYGQWCGEGAHWTNEATNSGNGYSTDQKFMLVYNNAHVLEEVSEFEDDTYTIRSHKGYASFAWMNAFSVPEGVEAYTGAWRDGDIELTRIADGIVPAYKGVILYDTQARDTYEVIETADEATAYNALTNDLQGAATGNVTRDGSKMTYVLGDIDNVIAFYEYRGDYMPQNKAYLIAPGQQSAVQKQVRIRFAPTVTTSMEQTATEEGMIYDVMGRAYPAQDINALPQGVYFRNGTKTVVVR